MSLQQIIEDAFENRANFNPNDATDDVRAAVNDVLAQLDAGTLRVAEKKTVNGSSTNGSKKRYYYPFV